MHGRVFHRLSLVALGVLSVGLLGWPAHTGAQTLGDITGTVGGTVGTVTGTVPGIVGGTTTVLGDTGTLAAGSLDSLYSEADSISTSIVSADVPSARVVDRISYVEAAELAWFGAKVLHPRTIAPAVAQKIPVRVLNTHNIASPGTLITEEGDTRVDAGPRAVAVKRGITVVHMTSNKMLGAHGFLARLGFFLEGLDGIGLFGLRHKLERSG